MKYIFLLIVMTSFNCFAGEIETYLLAQGFHEKPIPKDELLQKANHAKLEYCVESNSGKIFVRAQLASCRDNPQKLIAGNLIYQATDNGEWGGNLSVTDTSGASKILINDNVVKIIEHNKQFYVFTGLAHLGSNKGALHKVSKIDTQPVVEKLVNLSGAPYTIVTTSENGSLLFIIVTADDLAIFDQSTGKLNTVARGFWSSLYPGSVILKDKQLLIGMRSGVVLIKLGTKFNVEQTQYFTK